MKTPLTITASVWNYCQNSCDYCVSGSDSPQWAFTGSFKLFSPPGDEDLNHPQLIYKHGVDYYERLCTDKIKYLNKKDVLDFDFLIYWLMNNAPDAVIHLSGGEPLLRPDIEAQTKKLIDAGFEVCMFTNGLLIPKRKKLLDMPLTWLVAHHKQNDIDKFLKSAELIKDKPHLITRVLADSRDLKIKAELEKKYTGFNFEWKSCNAPIRTDGFKYLNEDVHQVASGVLHLIISDGSIFPCNTLKFGSIGNIYSNTYDKQKAQSLDKFCFNCVSVNGCSAYQTAVKVDTIQRKL